MTNNPSTDDFFPQRDEEVSVYRATIIFAKPPPVLPSYGSRVPVSLRVEGDVREYVDNELHERLVSGTGKRAWRRQELSVKAVSQGPDMQSWVIDARHKGDYCDEWEPDLSVIFDAQGLGQEKPDTVWKDAYRTDSRVSAHGLLTVRRSQRVEPRPSHTTQTLGGQGSIGSKGDDREDSTNPA